MTTGPMLLRTGAGGENGVNEAERVSVFDLDAGALDGRCGERE